MTSNVRDAVARATRELSAAGVASPQVDALELAAHVAGVSRSRLLLVPDFTDTQAADFADLVAKRAQRVPLQHLTGHAVLGPVDLQVGPGVFIPRPETELLWDWAVRAIGGPDGLVVDLCAGSGALALAIAQSCPAARVIAVELDDEALVWTRRNATARAAAGDNPIEVCQGDVRDPALLADLSGAVDLVVSNPPYVPEAAELEPEVCVHDPGLAVFAGTDGLSVIRPMVATLARLLRPGGLVGIEHDDSNGDGVAELLVESGRFAEVRQHTDLAGRPRFVTATRKDTTSADGWVSPPRASARMKR